MNKAIINQLPLDNLRGRRVFVRIDADAQPLASGAVDESKLRASLPTLEYLIGADARVIIGTHLGDPQGQVRDSLRLDPVAERLSQLLARQVRKLDSAVGREALHAVTGMQHGEVVLLENLRFHPGEAANDADFARQLGLLADIYCNDAFALAADGAASTVGITRHARPAVAGLAMARELMMIEAVLHKPEPPFIGLIAGARIGEKLPILENLLPKLDRLFIGGALAYTFLKVKGRGIGAAPVDETFLRQAEEMMFQVEGKVEIVLPQDFIVVNAGEMRAFEGEGRKGRVPVYRRVLDTEIRPSDLPVDIGPGTVNRIKGLFDGARTIIWNGPLGRWEIEPFGEGTREVAKLVVEHVSPRSQRSLLCGGSLASAIRSFGLPVERVRHLSAGGESALRMLAGNPLPAVSALDDETDLVAPVESRRRRILIPVDGSAHSLEAARRLSSFINTGGVEITLLHVHELPPFSTEWAQADPELKGRHEAAYRPEAERIFAETNAALARQGVTSHQQVVLDGNPADQILKYADEIGADLIAMGSQGKTGVVRLLMGSVSRKVLDQAKCPVLIARIPDEEMVKAGLIEG